MRFVKSVQGKIAATTDDTEQAAAYRADLHESLSLMLQAIVDDHQKG
jgi:hypothetical protein